MVQNEESVDTTSEDVGNQQSPEEEIAKKLETLTAVEAVVNEYARTIAKRHFIPEHHFSVHLTTAQRGIMMLQAGPVVHIYLLWPHAQPQINTLLKNAFDSIKRHDLRRSCEIVPYAYVKRQKAEHKKLLRKSFGDDIGNILPDMLAKSRVSFDMTYTYTMTDKKTGETITRTSEELGFRSHFDAEINMRLELSRIVKSKYVTEIHLDEYDETPELDALEEKIEEKENE